MLNKTLTPLFPIFILLFSACQERPDLSKIEKEILALHEQERAFHFEKKAPEFAASLSDNIIMVNKGKVTHPTRQENEERFKNYFTSVEFVEWDDTAEPLVKISADGKMAYVVVQKRVTTKYENEPGDTVQGTTDFAWVSIYEKENGAWKITCNASTNVPEAAD